MRWLKNRRGGVMIIVLIVVVLLFPVVVTSYIDLTALTRIHKTVKRSLSLAAKSAASRLDWDEVPYGRFAIHVPEATEAFARVMDLNMGIPGAEKRGDYYEYVNPENGNTIRYFMVVYNGNADRPGPPEEFPSPGTVPREVFGRGNLQILVDRPTVFAVATVEYKLFPALGGYRVKFTQIASAQVNELPEAP